MPTIINGTTGIDNVQDGTITSSDLASGASLANIGAGNITPSYLSTQSQYTGFKNRIINGAMVIDQRNAGASVTVNDTGIYTLDRWVAVDLTDGSLTVQQIADAPTGFTNSLRVTVATADTSLGAGQWAAIRQPIEGFNVADLGYGTANAQTITLSFWVKSSLTGTFGGSLQNGAQDRGYPFTYTISAANTWEYKTVTVAGDTTGTWLTNNGVGLRIQFSIGSNSANAATAGAWTAGAIYTATGATNVIATNGATFQVTGVQLEKGSTATSFDYRPYGTELALCQRYYYQHVSGLGQTIGIGIMYNSTLMVTTVQFPATMRTVPSLVSSNNTNNFAFYRNGTSDVFDLFTSMFDASTTCANIRNDNQVSGTAGQAGFVIAELSTARLAFNSEL